MVSAQILRVYDFSMVSSTAGMNLVHNRLQAHQPRYVGADNSDNLRCLSSEIASVS